MSKDSSAKYYQDKKERMQEQAHKNYQSLSNSEKDKTVVEDAKSSKKMKNKSWLTIEKNILKEQKDALLHL